MTGIGRGGGLNFKWVFSWASVDVVILVLQYTIFIRLPLKLKIGDFFWKGSFSTFMFIPFVRKSFLSEYFKFSLGIFDSSYRFKNSINLKRLNHPIHLILERVISRTIGHNIKSKKRVLVKHPKFCQTFN